jgi:catalase
MTTGTIGNQALAQELLDALDALSGLHAGFRPVHAKGLMCSGTFTPSAEAAKPTRAPHATSPIFDPLPRIDGIDSSGDPLTNVRADLYLLSVRRRRAAQQR